MQLRGLFPQKIQFKDFEISHEFPDIGHRMLVINAHRLNHAKAEVQVLLAFHDITQFRKNEDQLREAQQQLKLALEGGSVGTWGWDLATDLMAGSKEEAQLYGLEEGVFFKTYTEWENALYHDDVDSVRESIQSSIREKKPLDIEFRIVHKRGQIRWLLSKANVYLNNTGKVERMMGVNIDITERKQAVEALADSEKRFHTLSDQAPVMIWMSDAEKNCNFVNKTWLTFTGKTMQQETGQGWYEGIHDEDRENFLKVYDQAYRDRSGFRADYRLKRHDNEYRWVMAHGVPRYTNNDTFTGLIGTCIDITERIDLEKQKDDFMSIASHELKTPVTSIKAYTQILHEKFRRLNESGAADMLGRLDNQIDKLASLINTLLDVSRVQTGQMDYDKQSFEVRPFVQEVTEEIQRTTSKHQIVAEINTDGNVYADKARTGQVLNNLISNAIKYSPEADRIVVTVNAEADRIIFSVRDFGIGIPKDMHERIFQRFFRGSETAGNRVSGLGLGLYISSEIIRQQGGDIWLDSEPGKGSRFTFSLPSGENPH